MNLIKKNSKSPILALPEFKRPEISPKNGCRAPVADEPMTSIPNWRCLFENIRTEVTELGGRPRNYLASLEVRGKIHLSRPLEFTPHNPEGICAGPASP
jgi:hypothetical protein